MLRCAAYIRVSKDKEDQNTSIKNQKELLIQYANQQGWKISNFYTDIKSGTITDRKELNKLISDISDKKVDVILSKELSRLARNVELCHTIKRVVEDNYIHLVTLDGAVNTIKGDRGLFGLYAWIYEQEAQKTSERIKYSLQSRANLGLFNGSVPAYGYYCSDGKLYIRDDYTVDIVKRIFSEYMKGKGYDSIAMSLYNESVPTPSMLANKSNKTDKWHGATIRKMLSNEVYIGNMVQLKERTISVTCKKRTNDSKHCISIKNTHKPIITREDFMLVQELIKTRTKQKVHQSSHLFTNVIFCADCGKGMHYKKNRRGYVCGGFNKHGKKACTDHIVRESELSDLILSDIKYFIKSIKNTNLYDEFKLSIDNLTSKNKAMLDRYSSELDVLSNRKSKALIKLIDEIISKDDYNYFLDDSNKKIKELESKILECTNSLNKLKNNAIIHELDKLKKEIINPKELTPELLLRFVKRIEIKENGDARVFYRFSKSEFELIAS